MEQNEPTHITDCGIPCTVIGHPGDFFSSKGREPFVTIRFTNGNIGDFPARDILPIETAHKEPAQ